MAADKHLSECSSSFLVLLVQRQVLQVAAPVLLNVLPEQSFQRQRVLVSFQLMRGVRVFVEFRISRWFRK